MSTHHELFPLDGSESPETAAMRIHSIHVRRLENGKWAYATTSYAPDALENVGQLHQIYGGGDYTLEARDQEHKFLRVRRLTLPGAAKSLTGAPDAPPAPAAPAAPTGTMDSSTMLLAMMQTFMQVQAQQSTQTTNLLMAALGRSDSGNAELNARRAELERQARTEYNECLKVMLENARNQAPAAAGGQESFMQGVEFAQGLLNELVERQGSGDNPADMLSTLKDLLTGLSQFSKTSDAGGGAPATPPS